MTALRSYRAGIGFAAALLVAFACMGRASANEAREHFRRGEDAYARGDFDTAIDAWEAAYAQDPRPRLQYNLAQAYERVGRLEDAAHALARYIAEVPPRDPTVEHAQARLATVRARIERTAVRLVGGVAGAEVMVDGALRGALPLEAPLPVAPGEHRVEVRASGAYFETRVMVAAGQVMDIPVTLQAQRSEAPQPNEAPASDQRLLPWILVGTGGAAVLTASVLGALALSSAKEATSKDAPEASRARGLALATDVIGIAGLIALGSAVTLLWLHGSPARDETRAVSLAGFAVPGLAGVSATGRFD